MPPPICLFFRGQSLDLAYQMLYNEIKRGYAYGTNQYAHGRRFEKTGRGAL